MKTKLRSALLGILIAATVAVQPPRVVAQVVDDAGVEAFGTSKFWDYALCGASIVVASGTGGWVMAALICGRALTEHWTR